MFHQLIQISPLHTQLLSYWHQGSRKSAWVSTKMPTSLWTPQEACLGDHFTGKPLLFQLQLFYRTGSSCCLTPVFPPGAYCISHLQSEIWVCHWVLLLEFGWHSPLTVQCLWAGAVNSCTPMGMEGVTLLCFSTPQTVFIQESWSPTQSMRATRTILALSVSYKFMKKQYTHAKEQECHKYPHLPEQA